MKQRALWSAVVLAGSAEAGVLIAAHPVLLNHLFFQRRIADGITAGSTKG